MRLANGFIVALALSCVAVPASAQEFTVDVGRQVPYKNHKFRVQWDGRYVPGVVMVSALRRHTRVVHGREGGDPGSERVSPGTTSFEPVTLVRGRTHDRSFEQWANRVYRYGAGLGAEVALRDYRKDIVVEVMNEAGQLVLRYLLYRCWPSEYVPISTLESRGSDTLTETLVLQCEGFQRDRDVREPEPPSP